MVEVIVIRKYRFILFWFAAIFLFRETGITYGQDRRDIEELIQDIVSDVINRTADKTSGII